MGAEHACARHQRAFQLGLALSSMTLGRTYLEVQASECKAYTAVIICKGKWPYAIDVYGHLISNSQKDGSNLNCSSTQL